MSRKTSPKKPRVALLFRYGAAEHTTFLPALEALAKNLAHTHEVHHIGMNSPLRIPDGLRASLHVRKLPFTVRRKSTFDKFFKAAVWIALLPFIAVWLRLRGYWGVFVDEAVPLTAPILRLFFGRRVAFTLHDFFVDIYLEPNRLLRPAGRFIKWIDRSAWRTLPLILCRVEAAKRRLVSAGFDPARIVVACDPCDLTLFSPGDRAAARRELGLPADAFILVHHGVMHPNKGNDRLIRAAARLRETLPDLLLLLVGDGPAMGGLRKLCAELGCESAVRFTGWVPDIATVSRYLQASDAAVALRIGQPGDHFHVTSTLAHNLATGLPTLAARLEGFAEIVQDGRNGLLFDPAVGEEFDAALTRLHADAHLRGELAANGRRTALRLFDVDRVAATMAGALRSMMNDEPPGDRSEQRGQAQPEQPGPPGDRA